MTEILFYSATGAVRKLAHAIADGAEKKGLEVKIRTVPKVSPASELTDPAVPKEGEVYCSKEDLLNCSGLALGSPTRFGSMASPMKHFLDSTGDLWATNALEGIPGCAFTSTGSMHGGQEITLMNLLTYQLHQGMIEDFHEEEMVLFWGALRLPASSLLWRRILIIRR